MRIYGNRQLKTLPGLLTRPTSSKVREALFNIWQGRVTDSYWLDLCAGNGSIGAEALCRGASSVVGVEKSGKACDIIQANWQKLAHSTQSFQVLRGNILTILPSLIGRRFDLIYFDPPYASGLYLPVLTAIAELQLLATEGEIAVEHDEQYQPSREILSLTQCRQKHYSKTTVTFYC